MGRGGGAVPPPERRCVRPLVLVSLAKQHPLIM